MLKKVFGGLFLSCTLFVTFSNVHVHNMNEVHECPDFRCWLYFIVAYLIVSPVRLISASFLSIVLQPSCFVFYFLCSLASLALSVELIALHKHKYQLVEVRYGISCIRNLLLVAVLNVHDEHFYRTLFLMAMEHFLPQYWFRQSAWVCFIMIFLKAYFIAVGRTKCNMFLWFNRAI